MRLLSMVSEEEWEMAGPDWKWWEPLFWWTASALRWLGLAMSAVGFVLAGRGMVQRALLRRWDVGQANVEEGDAG